MSRATLLGALALAACADPVAPGDASTRLELVQGPTEIAVPGQRFDTIAVRLVRADGSPAPFAGVTWSGHGTIAPFDDITDAQGIARAEWTLPRHTSLPYPSGPSGQYTLAAVANSGGVVAMEVTARAFTVSQFDATDTYACGVRSGELWCWGDLVFPLNWSFGTTVPRRIPLPEIAAPVEVATSPEMVCIRSFAGPVLCAAREHGGSFSAVGALSAVRDLAAAGDFFCGRVTNNSVRCWNRTGPTALLAIEKLPGNAVAIAAGDGFACAVHTNGDAWCWGRNDLGQLGNGLRTASDTPTRVLTGASFVDIIAEGSGACGITATQELWCWGTTAATGGWEVPVRIDLPGVRGPNVILGASGAGYVYNDGALAGWHRTLPWSLGPSFTRHPTTAVAGNEQLCVRIEGGEIHCSWILLYGGGDTSPYPAELVPVPDPASAGGEG